MDAMSQSFNDPFLLYTQCAIRKTVAGVVFIHLKFLIASSTYESNPIEICLMADAMDVTDNDPVTKLL
jgi:hypothetical protein